MRVEHAVDELHGVLGAERPRQLERLVDDDGAAASPGRAATRTTAMRRIRRSSTAIRSRRQCSAVSAMSASIASSRATVSRASAVANARRASAGAVRVRPLLARRTSRRRGRRPRGRLRTGRASAARPPGAVPRSFRARGAAQRGEDRAHSRRRVRRCDRGRAITVAISTAATAASQPLLAGPSTARSSASSAELVVSTPNVIGTPVAAAAAVSPCATADAMYSKCGVAPRIRQPRQTTASNRPAGGGLLRGRRDLERPRHADHGDVVRHARRAPPAPPARPPAAVRSRSR